MISKLRPLPEWRLPISKSGCRAPAALFSSIVWATSAMRGTRAICRCVGCYRETKSESIVDDEMTGADATIPGGSLLKRYTLVSWPGSSLNKLFTLIRHTGGRRYPDAFEIPGFRVAPAFAGVARNDDRIILRISDQDAKQLQLYVTGSTSFGVRCPPWRVLRRFSVAVKSMVCSFCLRTTP